MTAVTPLIEADEGHQGTLLLGATRIKQKSITSHITDNVSPKKSDPHSKQQLWRGSVQISPTGQQCQRQILHVRSIIQNLSLFSLAKQAVSEDSPCASLHLKPQSWQKHKLQTKMPHLQKNIFSVLKNLKTREIGSKWPVAEHLQHPKFQCRVINLSQLSTFMQEILWKSIKNENKKEKKGA